MKFLYITHLSGKRVNRLWISALTAAKQLGFEVHLACNEEQIEQPGWSEDCKQYGIIDHHIDFNRNPLDKENKLAYKELLDLMEKEKFDIVHCNTPVGGLLGRLCANKAHIPYVIYQAHGFHFWKGAPVKNWMFYYLVERHMAKYADVLITINQEDYHRAEKFKLKQGGRLEYVHGVGVDLKKFESPKMGRQQKRQELGIGPESFVFITAGELIERKNQILAIKSFAKADIPDSFLLICGMGELEDQLKKAINDLHMSDRVKMLGFRQDMVDLLNASDAFVFPSFQEGLPVAQMEAMAAGLPCIVSKIRGNTDLLGENYEYYFSPYKEDELVEKMQKMRSDTKSWKVYSREHVAPYSFDGVTQELTKIYQLAMEKV